MTFDEPVVRLRSGATVLSCIAGLVRKLQAAGHTITTDPRGGDVVVDPPVNYNCWFVLDSNWADVVAVLEDFQTAPIQGRRH